MSIDRRHQAAATTKSFVLAVGLAVIWGVPLTSMGTQLFYNPDFENDTVTVNPPIGTGSLPATWGGTQISTVNGFADVSVQAVGSLFDGGSTKSMLLYDNNLVDSRIDVGQSLHYTAPYLNGRPAVLTLDLRFNGSGSATDLLAVQLGSSVNNGVYSYWTGSQFGLAGLNGGAWVPGLNIGTWYRIEMDFPAVGAGSNLFTVSVTDYPTLTTVSHQFTLSNGDGITGYNYLDFSSGFGAGNTVDVNLDNITMDVIPEPGTIMLFGIGAAVLWLRRRALRSV